MVGSVDRLFAGLRLGKANSQVQRSSTRQPKRSSKSKVVFKLHMIDKRDMPTRDILAKVGTIAYRLELPEQLGRVHSTFHVSNLKKCLSDKTLVIPLDEIQIDDKLHFVEEPIKIMDREVKSLKQSRIPTVKVLRSDIRASFRARNAESSSVYLEEQQTCVKLLLPVVSDTKDHLCKISNGHGCSLGIIHELVGRRVIVHGLPDVVVTNGGTIRQFAMQLWATQKAIPAKSALDALP
ncbi:hypothetical protein Tco_0772364 [Tanacetum coccineum]|uniref:Tf2-1-like SH3-like domain-containing protein n=1 Tax=Tanacetum coccineum TaxID=301880 RepID=A0ABQ4ZHQ0_9ASTR